MLRDGLREDTLSRGVGMGVHQRDVQMLRSHALEKRRHVKNVYPIFLQNSYTVACTTANSYGVKSNIAGSKATVKPIPSALHN